MNVASNIVLAVVCTAALIATAIASPPTHKSTSAQPGHATISPYAGQERRAVTSLSPDDVDALLAGRGWGLAKPAELNGYPGPVHVFELVNDLKLTDAQRQSVQAAFDRMKAKAVDLGVRYVAAERAIDDAFRSGMTAVELSRRVVEAEKLRTALRLAHLGAHIEITPLLSPHQRLRYAQLRGYADDAAHDHGRH